MDIQILIYLLGFLFLEEGCREVFKGRQKSQVDTFGREVRMKEGKEI